MVITKNILPLTASERDTGTRTLNGLKEITHNHFHRDCFIFQKTKTCSMFWTMPHTHPHYYTLKNTFKQSTFRGFQGASYFQPVSLYVSLKYVRNDIPEHHRTVKHIKLTLTLLKKASFPPYISCRRSALQLTLTFDLPQQTYSI